MSSTIAMSVSGMPKPAMASTWRRPVGSGWCARRPTSVLPVVLDHREGSAIARCLRMGALLGRPREPPDDDGQPLTIPFLDGRLFPARPRLQPEDRGGDRLRAIAERLAIQALGHLAVRLDLAGVQFVSIMLSERLRV